MDNLFAGRHVLAEFTGVDAQICDDLEGLRATLHSCLTRAGATILDIVGKQFQPQGVTMIAVLSESHASIHTYPERGAMFIDVFTCGDAADPVEAVNLLAAELKAGHTEIRTISRGIGPKPVIEPITTGMRREWDVNEVIVDTHTAFQHLLIADTAQGRSLFCDDERQSTELSQLVYHEALMVPAFLLADKVERVLIVGSSEGVASQMSVAAGASLVDHVDIDTEAVELCAEHLPYGYSPAELAEGLTKTGAIKVHYTDGWQFLIDAENSGATYDIVVVDLPDERPEFAQHNRLYENEFLTRCKNVLAPGGVVAVQSGCPTMWRNDSLKKSWIRFHEVFDTVAYYGSDEHEWAFLFGRADHVAQPTEQMVARLETLPYTPESIDADAVRGCGIPPHAVRALPVPARV